MELKDVILSTLAEIQDGEEQDTVEQNVSKEPKKESQSPQYINQANTESELSYLKSIRERLLVLFEGFGAPNNSNIEAKVDLTLNFLEYVLATIETRVEKLEEGNKL